MAQESMESADNHSVVYYIELPNIPTYQIIQNEDKAQLTFSASPTGESVPTTMESEVYYVKSPTSQGELDYFRARVNDSPNSTHHHSTLSHLHDHQLGLQRDVDASVGSFASSSPSSQTSSVPQEFFFVSEFDSYSRSACKTAPHLIDHMYSLNCTPGHCKCGICEDDEDDDDDDDDDEDEDDDDDEPDDEGGDKGSMGSINKGGHFRPQPLRHHEYERRDKTNFKCCYCDYTASRRQHVKQHLATHLKDKPFKCKLCNDYSASQKQSLVAHMLRFHYKRKPFKCDMCEYSAFRKQHVVVHMGKHLKEKPYKCDNCDFQTSWKEYLGVHKKNLHPESKTFKPWCE